MTIIINLDNLLDELNNCPIEHENHDLYGTGTESVTCWKISNKDIEQKLCALGIDPVGVDTYDMYYIIGRFTHMKSIFGDKPTPK